MLYQIPDEVPGRGAPATRPVRGREFGMVDLYSFDADTETSTPATRHVSGLRTLFSRCGVPARPVWRTRARSVARTPRSSCFSPTSARTTSSSARIAATRRIRSAPSSASRRPTRGAPRPWKTSRRPPRRRSRHWPRFLAFPAPRTLKAVFYTADREPIPRGDSGAATSASTRSSSATP